jgi:2,2-dialkylglycine decarboxylase (pyruvate)
MLPHRPSECLLRKRPRNNSPKTGLSENERRPSELKNIDYWSQYGDYVLMAMPYADEILVEARGSTLRDAEGKELLDLAAGMFCCVLGHNHPKFIERIAGQTQQLLHTGTQFLSPAVMQASYKLAQVTPGRLQKSIFLSTGTEANEFAFRLAKTYTGRTGIMGLSRGYYGTSLATKSCSSLASHTLKDSLPAVPDTVRLPITPQCAECFSHVTRPPCGFPCLGSAESWIGDWSNIAAVIVEPVLSAGGMLVPPPGYLKSLRELAHRNGALFIVDEAQTGFGRTGKWFAIEHHDAEPDILTMSKSVGNGFPVAAVITTAEIADEVVSKGLWNLSSHQSDPVAATAVSAVIDIVQEEHLLLRAHENGNYFMDRLRELSAREPLIRNVRGQGLMIGFDLLPPEPEKAPELINSFMFGCRARGVHLTYGYGGVNFRVIPPLVITRAEIDFAIRVMEEALRAAKTNPAQTDWPANPYTKRIFENPYWRRLFNYWWRSSPADWIEKSRELLQERFGSGR